MTVKNPCVDLDESIQAARKLLENWKRKEAEDASKPVGERTKQNYQAEVDAYGINNGLMGFIGPF